MMHTQIRDGTQTRYAYQQMIISEDVWPGVQYLDQMDVGALFLNKLLVQMVNCGYEGDFEDRESAIRFLKGRCQMTDAHISRQTLNNWLSTGKIAHNTVARENIYKLCFALNMNALQTEEFFLKAYLDRPFNYKSLYETVCFFCLNHRGQYRYSDVARIKAEIEAAPSLVREESPDFTVMIRQHLKSCVTETDLMEYWRHQSASLGPAKHTAKNEVNALLKRCYEVVPDDHKKKIHTPGLLLEEIFDYRARGIVGGRKVHSFSIAKSSLPDNIKLNFPDPQKMWKILKDIENHTDKTTDDMLRKAIIALNFYAFYATEARKKKNPRKYGNPSKMPFEEFTAQLNLCLERCGYLRIYWRNPYDWMFGYCARQRDPIAVLRKIIAVCYLDDELFGDEGSEE